MKKILVAWTLLMVMIFASLTIMGFRIKSKTINNLMEEEIVKQTEKYLGLYTNLYPSKGNTKKITVDTLIKEGYDPKLEKGCDGYIIVEHSDMGFKYNPYIKCKEYTTKGYEEKN